MAILHFSHKSAPHKSLFRQAKVDQDLGLYLSNRPGYHAIVILNPKLQSGHLDATLLPQAAPRVVVVEDCPGVVECFKACILKAAPDARILAFHDGDSAWACLEETSPDLLISDLSHPGMRGVEMLSALALKGVDYPILMVSGVMGMLETQARRNAGPRLNVHYLSKPFVPDEFIFLLKQCLHRLSPQDQLVQWSASLSRPLRIVQLDDEEPILDIVAYILRQCFPNLLLYQFQKSPSAWRILTEARPDLLITDDIMHGNRDWNGESIVRCLVERGVDYPILVLSAWPPTQAWVQRVGADYGKLSFLCEPFAPSHFYRELGKFFGPLNHP